jgi:hypothetical protein
MLFCARYLIEYLDTQLSSRETSYSRCFNEQYAVCGLGYFIRLHGFVTILQERATRADEVAATC